MALVYRAPASSPDCPQAMAALLESSRCGYDVRYVGPDKDVPVSTLAVAGAAMYAKPGGGVRARLPESAPAPRRDPGVRPLR
ncbi:hypothetical protein OHA72_56450 [Dactylosporangium sp. NBC_01737]|uniref:hypothetical protein n=1 Tax=Dactylosporangium sp. NBC_01737 TaxID=2975959 RepID=UPI002E15B351|nr:hypothetical protein OHA72_56450 [Dactylosporangium sp. NBC_01737]